MVEVLVFVTCAVRDRVVRDLVKVSYVAVTFTVPETRSEAIFWISMPSIGEQWQHVAYTPEVIVLSAARTTRDGLIFLRARCTAD